MLDLLATAPSIATQDSGVSWGAMLAILGSLLTVGMAIAGIAFNFMKATLSDLKREVVKTREDLTNLVTKVEEKVDKVETDSRGARANLWQEHRRLERDHDKAITELETQMRLWQNTHNTGPVQ
jgi:biopolymer transport protein ExbB/TolQ